MIEPMKTPMTRAEFEHRFHLLREQIRQGRFHVAQGMALGIEEIRYLPNGRIDFLSVNESARLQANMMIQLQSESFNKMLKTKETKDVQRDSSPGHVEDEPSEQGRRR